MPRCSICREKWIVPLLMRGQQPEQMCADCVRRQYYGAIVEGLTTNNISSDVADVEETLAAFDALAELMIDRHRLIRAHRRDMSEEQRAAQHAARDSYYEGQAEGRAEGRGDW